MPRRSAHEVTDVEVIDRQCAAPRAAIGSLDINGVSTLVALFGAHSVR